MSDLSPLPPATPGRYRHYKGGEYEVIDIARHSETLEPLVVYRPLYNQTGLWVRPYPMFFGEVEHNGRLQPRFALLAEAAVPALPPAVFEPQLGPTVRWQLCDAVTHDRDRRVSRKSSG